MIKAYVKQMLLGLILIVLSAWVFGEKAVNNILQPHLPVGAWTLGFWIVGSILVGTIGLYYFIWGFSTWVIEATPPKVPKFIKSFNRWISKDGL